MSDFNMLVERKETTEEAVMGILTAGDQKFYTLEPPFRPEDVKPRAIPAGTYDVSLRYSPKHSRIVPHIANVPGFEAIEIHWGNYPKDTEGCLLVGKTHSRNFVGNSRLAFDELFSVLQDMEAMAVRIFITYEDPPVVFPDETPATEAGAQ